ncbi:hypothetical protein Tco_0778782 [Tanacetum coccineum]
MMSLINRKRTLKSDLADLDWIIDKGCGDVEIVNKRANVVRSLQELENLQSLEAAQKSKIKWAIEGDENSKYYHGILNKKRSQLAIRGILVDGNWIDSPHLVKRKFLSHFKNRFDHPQDSRIELDLNFPNTLQPDQIIDLECDVSKDKIKRAVWDCGIDKSPGPDGFTFGFYRRYWNILESDVVDVVTIFFHAKVRIILVRNGALGFKGAHRSSRGSIIVNGSPTEEFQFHKGLKQGNGSILWFFGKETWHGDVAFKFLFPRGYALESCKNIDVASKLSQNSLAFTFRREPRGGVEQDQFDSLKALSKRLLSQGI